MTVLGKEILKSMRSTEEKAAQLTWLVTMAGKGTVGVKVVESKGGDRPNHTHVSLSPVRRVSHSPTPCMLPRVGAPLGI